MNIYLIGYRGSGKSSLGKVLSKMLKWKFIDIDQEIVNNTGRTIPEIFSQSGEAAFRNIESEILKTVSSGQNQVVSTGGGIIILGQNRDLIKKTGFCVYLTADIPILITRIKGDKNRPALTDLTLEDEVNSVMKVREPIYQSIADIKVDTGISNINECAKVILDSLQSIK